ncbi:hypothetical protein VOLCADRAFT_92718 [Volvox carteri f. nagariensis]|uniref:ATP-dependent DNA helicase RecG n=1 Tax=Volvox carteri f. nagariensis TaxID=3068 RepID=D8U0C5_VOLCA|nr:uncharacterized protein VOLCADRAFT_92718 [Volvox carteri f. nagariensis]EFJ46918.1 hypothetical protein VOLCADRAFT_92718 [Volvox carteri f. nagariensis]|eukprot:XP_002952127.1 hypothetical protein VOLCADRAFT_92718 [Volvox carteri f. nagariensis]
MSRESLRQLIGDTFSSLVNPNGRGRPVQMDPRVTSLTGITPDMLLHAPGEPWVALAFLCWLYQRCRAGGGVRPALVGHNLRVYDSPFLARMLARQGCLVPYSWCMVDSLRLARRWKLWSSRGGGDFKLQSLRELYNIPRRDEHRALPDALVTVDVLAAMVRHRVNGSPLPYSPSPLEPMEVVQQALNDGTFAWFDQSPEETISVGGGGGGGGGGSSRPHRENPVPDRGDILQLLPWKKPFRTDPWDRVLPRRRPPLLTKLEEAAAAGRLATPHALLLAVPRAVVLHRTTLSVAELAAALAAKNAIRSRVGSWREVRDELRDTPGIPVALHARFGDIKVVRLHPRGWGMTGVLQLLPGQILPGGEEGEGVEVGNGQAGGSSSSSTALGSSRTGDGSCALPGWRESHRMERQQQQQQELAGLEIEASWFDFANPRADKGLRQLRDSYIEPGSEWVVRGVMRPKPVSGPRFEVVGPDVLPAASFEPSRDLVTTTYKAATPLTAGEVAEVAEGVLGALKGGEIDLPEPLPPTARTELHRLLTSGSTDGYCSSTKTSGSSNSRINKNASAGIDTDVGVSSGSGSSTIDTGPNWAPVSADPLVAAAVQALGFELTGAQRRAVGEVLGDMRPERGSTMYRLLQGDVGSGKTVVALLAMLAAASCGLQSLLVVPTTVLAQQHHRNLGALMDRLPKRVRRKAGLEGEPLLLTGEAKAKEKRLAAQGLADGSILLAVGTHGLLNLTEFHNLGLLVLDESHKFGVVQMERLSSLIAQRPPHLLNMSATPIPRTLAAAMYGHMDVSRLDELPPGRTPVLTKLVQDDSDMPYRDPDAVREMDAMWEEVLREELKNAVDQATVLAARFEPLGVPTRLLHGRMKAEEKNAALEAFRGGDVRLLVCTTVVEVGVDVPEATVVVVEHAERFGLAQLHQLRGRVGRGGRRGMCFLCVPFGDRAARERLGIMEHTNDGFEVAEWDLEQRGMGHLFGSGTRQHGRMDVSGVTAAVIEEVGAPAAGVALVEAARRAAAAVAREWEEEGEEVGVSEGREMALKAMAVFRPEPLTAAEALAV